MSKNGGATVVPESRLEHKGGMAVTSPAQPYRVRVRLEGDADILFHRYDCEAVASKGAAKKGSAEKKSDNIESYVYRDSAGVLVMPAGNVKAMLKDAARSFPDPRSPRKSARDLIAAGVRVLGDSSFGAKAWSYIDKRRVCVQRNAVTRHRPALERGWTLEVIVMVIAPGYISETFLRELWSTAGLTIGLGDFRPDFGTFGVTMFERLEEE